VRPVARSSTTKRRSLGHSQIKTTAGGTPELFESILSLSLFVWGAPPFRFWFWKGWVFVFIFSSGPLSNPPDRSSPIHDLRSCRTTNCSIATLSDAAPVSSAQDSRACSSVSLSSFPSSTH
jgi:hypothetical protein